MPVHKYRDVSEMPRVPESPTGALEARMRAAWNRSVLLHPRRFSRGVTRFRSIEEANAQREAERAEAMRANAKSR